MVTCRTTDCNGKPRARGICVRCYAHLRVLVTKGQITWDELVKLGLVDEASEGPAKDTPIKRAMAAAKVKLRPSQKLAVIDPDQEPPVYDRAAAMAALKTSAVEPDPHVPPQSYQPANSTILLNKMRQVSQETIFRGIPIEYEPDGPELVNDGKVFIISPEQAAAVQDNPELTLHMVTPKLEREIKEIADAEAAKLAIGLDVDLDTEVDEEPEDPKQVARRRKIEAKHLSQQKEDAKHGPPMPMPPPPCAGPSADYVDMGEIRNIIAQSDSGCKVEFSPSAPGAQAEMPTPWLADKREASRQNKPIVTEHDNVPFSLPLSPPEPAPPEHEIIVTPGALEDLEKLSPKGLPAPLPAGENTKPIILLSDPTPEADYPSDIDSEIQVPPPEATETEAKPWE